MDASTLLYTRLGEISEDPNDPESLADLLVCAFGAFERYYICWKTQSGEYRQGKRAHLLPQALDLHIVDGYDLPPALKNWLYPNDGTTRDFPTLQVVFGRGEEYFASDRNGKLEYKEPEVKKPVEDEEKIDKPALRRARTVSFLRPLSDVSTRSESPITETTESRRSSSTSSRRASRPPSLSYSRTSSMVSMISELVERSPDVHPARTSQPSLVSQQTSLGIDTTAADRSLSPKKQNTQGPQVHAKFTTEHPVTGLETPIPRPIVGQLQSRNLDSRKLTELKIPEGYMLVPIASSPTLNPSTCTCSCHEMRLPQISKSDYVDTSTQTKTYLSAPRTALQVDTTKASGWPTNGYSALSHDDVSPLCNEYPTENPISMGRMMNYFCKPGYQLGDSLMSGLQSYQPLAYQYQDEFGEEALR